MELGNLLKLGVPIAIGLCVAAFAGWSATSHLLIPSQILQQPVAISVSTTSASSGSSVQQTTSKRAIFCATSGHTGTHLLTSLLEMFEDTLSEHEPEPRMLLDKYKGALPETRAEREKEKLNFIVNKINKSPNKTVYAEMSNMFIKTFWDLDFYSHFDSVHVIILRRWGPAVVQAHVNRGLGSDKFRTKTFWTQFVETMGLQDAALTWPADAEKNSMNRMVYYVLDIEERITRLRQQLAGKVTFVEVVYEELVKADLVYLRWLFTQLGYDMTDPLVAKLEKKIGALAEHHSIKRIAKPVSEMECANAMWHYMIKHQLRIAHQGLQELMRHRSTGHQMKVVAMAQVWQASEYIAEWLRQVLQYVDAVVLVDDKSSDSTVRIAEAYPGNVTVLQKTEWSFDEYAAQMRGLQEAVRQGATHIVCQDTDEVLTSNIIPYYRSMIASLPSGGMIDLYLWHPWNGTTELIASADSWKHWGTWGHTVLRTPAAYRPTPKSAKAWANNGEHHIGRLPSGVNKDGFIMLSPALGGLFHFKYANFEAYSIKIAWYEMMEWREVMAGKVKAQSTMDRLASPGNLHKFYASKWPLGIKTKRIPAGWSAGIDLLPFHVQQLTRVAREQQIARWRSEFSAATLEALLGPKSAAMVAALPVSESTGEN
eukprot:TRINITY_DN19724_c0_g1_i1.p1 TRINITY_DN19724_c0_g1~~TRINITY_DN19724_c0_g1_i1.p1  ORF type:complete len:653 (+),score=114.68 TRINITY_DN19724_c0_g1_i1:87-2045(+)